MVDMQIVVAPAKNVEAQYVEMAVPLYSYGCERKIKKALVHLKGIYSVNVDFSLKKVTIWGICNKYDILSTIKKKRKEACFWNPQDNLDIVNTSDQNNEFEDQLEAQTSSSFFKKTSTQQRHLALIITRSLNWKCWKKVFVKSYSF